MFPWLLTHTWDFYLSYNAIPSKATRSSNTSADRQDIFLYNWNKNGYRFACADPEGGAGGPDSPPPPLKNKKRYRLSKQYWAGSPEKSQSYKASIQCWAAIGPPAKRHLNGVSLAGRWCPTFSAIWILFPFIKKQFSELWAPSGRTFWIRAWVRVNNPNTRGIWKVLSMVFHLSSRFTNFIMFGIILKSYLSSMLWRKFHEDIMMQTRKI